MGGWGGLVGLMLESCCMYAYFFVVLILNIVSFCSLCCDVVQRRELVYSALRFKINLLSPSRNLNVAKH